MAFEDGILDISVDNGPASTSCWADEGFELGDYQGRGLWVVQPDGEQWTAMPFVGTPEVDGRGFGDRLRRCCGRRRTASSRAASAPLMVAAPRCGIHQTA